MGTDSLSLNIGTLSKMETNADEFIPLLRKLSPKWVQGPKGWNYLPLPSQAISAELELK